jgi:hypothetical protein
MAGAKLQMHVRVVFQAMHARTVGLSLGRLPTVVAQHVAVVHVAVHWGFGALTAKQNSLATPALEATYARMEALLQAGEAVAHASA